MALPFLLKHKRQDAGVITEHRPSDHEPESSEEGIDACSKDILEAVSTNDVKRLSKALKAAFDIFESSPHEEYEPSEESEQE